ncbi:TPA: hypothetical protein ACF31M_004570 [Vibrio parahaemolyticus]
MLTLDKVDYYHRCTTSTFIDLIRQGELTSTEVDLSGVSFEERINYLDKLRNIHRWILFREEGCIEYISADSALSNSKCHFYLYNFRINESEEWTSISEDFNKSISTLSRKANRKSVPKWVGTVMLDYLLISLIFYVLVKFGMSESLLSNPIESVVSYFSF